jgi:outer membrane protein assembly factor BamD
MNSTSFSTLRRLSLCVGLTSLLALGACASDKEKDTLPEGQPVEQLYTKATDLLDAKDYKSAAKAFAEVERQHPYSQWATRAQLMEAYSDYQQLEYDDAVTVLDQFIDLHPGNNDIAYAYYLRALCFYERIVDVRRDQSYSREALKGMQDIVSRYPDTTYARDAILKIALINDHLAGAEMEVGRWYMTQKVYTAAMGRFRTVIEKYQNTSHTPEALERLVECTIALGLSKEAQSTAAILGYNFPGSPWYDAAYKLLQAHDLAPEPDDESWISSMWHTVF